MERMADEEQGAGGKGGKGDGRRRVAVQPGGRTNQGGSMETMKTQVIPVRKNPDLMPLARHLYDKILEAWNDPDIRKDFEEWKKRQEAKA